MNTQRVDALLAFILMEAQNSDEFRERSLGPIHLIKYTYLADLAYAERYNGETYTGVNWQFYHFGPWDISLWQYIQPSLQKSGASATTFPSDYSSQDVVRWSIDSIDILRNAAKGITIELQGIISRFIRKYANHTPELLNFVYNTPPMLRAAPKEKLDFTPSGHELDPDGDIFYKKEHVQITVRQEKKIKEWKKISSELIKNKIQEKVAQKKSKKFIDTSLYDEVFFEGLATLDEGMSDPLHECSVTLHVQDDVWKSKARHGHKLP